MRQHCVAFVLLCRIAEAIFAELRFGADGRRQRMNAVQDMIVRYPSMFRDLYGRDAMIQKSQKANADSTPDRFANDPHAL